MSASALFGVSRIYGQATAAELTCTTCGETKPSEQFYWNFVVRRGERVGYRRSDCKKCHRKAQQARREREARERAGKPREPRRRPVRRDLTLARPSRGVADRSVSLLAPPRPAHPLDSTVPICVCGALKSSHRGKGATGGCAETGCGAFFLRGL